MRCRIFQVSGIVGMRTTNGRSKHFWTSLEVDVPKKITQVAVVDERNGEDTQSTTLLLSGCYDFVVCGSKRCFGSYTNGQPERGGTEMSEAQLFVATTFTEIYERVLVGPLFRPFAEQLVARIAPVRGDSVIDVACPRRRPWRRSRRPGRSGRRTPPPRPCSR